MDKKFYLGLMVVIIVIATASLFFVKYQRGAVVVTTCTSSEAVTVSEMQTSINSHTELSGLNLSLATDCKGTMTGLSEQKTLADKTIYYKTNTVIDITYENITVNDTTTNETHIEERQNSQQRDEKEYFWCSDNNQIKLSSKDINVVEKYFALYYTCVEEDLCKGGVSECTDSQKCVEGKCIEITITDCPSPYKIGNHTCNPQCIANSGCQDSEECIPGSIKELGVCSELKCLEKEIPQVHACVKVECNLDSHCVADKDINCDGISEKVNGTCLLATHMCDFPDISANASDTTLSTFNDINSIECSKWQVFYNQNKLFIIIGIVVVAILAVIFVAFMIWRRR